MYGYTGGIYIYIYIYLQGHSGILYSWSDTRHQHLCEARQIKCLGEGRTAWPYSPELLQLQRLRDALDHAIELGTVLINDAIIRECRADDGSFDVEMFKSLIDQQLGRLTPP